MKIDYCVFDNPMDAYNVEFEMNTNGLDSFGLHSLLQLHHAIITQCKLYISQSTTNKTVEWLKKEIRKYITRFPNMNPKPSQLEKIFEIANGYKPSPRRSSTWYMKKLYCFIGCVSRYNISHVSEIHHNNSTFSVGDEIELKDIRYRIVKFSMDSEQNISAVLTECGTSRKSVRRLDRLQQLQQQHSSGKTELPTQPTTTSSSSTTRKTGTHTIDTIDKKISKKRSYFCVYGCGQKRHKGRCIKTVHKRKPTTNKITPSTQQVIVQSPRRKGSTVDYKSKTGKKSKANTTRPLLCSRGCCNPPHRGNCKKTSKPSTPRRLCSRGCGKPPHRGNCRKKT